VRGPAALYGIEEFCPEREDVCVGGAHEEGVHRVFDLSLTETT